MSETLLERIDSVLARAADHDPNTVVAPMAVLWPDESRQWEPIIPALRESRPIISLGPFDSAVWQGPAYWIRCVIASTIDRDGLPDGTPIVYLPGVSRDVMRALDTLGPDLVSLGALQHQCQWFSHPNGKDWTVRALLANQERGLGLNVASDTATAHAIVSSLPALAVQPWSRLESKHIDAHFLNALLNPDPVRALLNFIDDPKSARAELAGGAWDAFVQQSKSDFGFDPAAAGEIEGARRLGEADGAWEQVWQRFRENPADYPHIPERLRMARPEALFTGRDGVWPQDNEAAEDQLRARLLDLPALTPDGARKEIDSLETRHRARRSSVWAQIGEAPVAGALEHLAEVARLTSTGSPETSVSEIAAWYAESGWRADRAAIAALTEVTVKNDVAAVESALTAVYRPWLHETATAMQTAIGPAANVGSYQAAAPPSVSTGEVIVFVDGLRLDVAHQLADRLKGAGLDVDVTSSLAALPTVTQTAKPALVPIDQTRLTAGPGLDARRAPDGPAAGVQVLRGLMGDADIQVLMNDETGNPSGIAWTEAGKLDSRGHELGAELVYELDNEVQRIAARIEELLDAGWSKITLVTDHGWILLPGGLPKNEGLPVAVTETKKGRCARVKEGADLAVPTVPWHWDPEVRIAVAPGISCFEANQTYEHGGVSPQECVVPRMAVTRIGTATTGAAITSIKWRGLTLIVDFAGLPEGAKVDLRASAGDPSSSIAEMGRITGGQGRVILLVGNEDLEGNEAQLVVASEDGSLLLQRSTTVGQNR